MLFALNRHIKVDSFLLRFLISFTCTLATMCVAWHLLGFIIERALERMSDGRPYMILMDGLYWLTLQCPSPSFPPLHVTGRSLVGDKNAWNEATKARWCLVHTPQERVTREAQGLFCLKRLCKALSVNSRPYIASPSHTDHMYILGFCEI